MITRASDATAPASRGQTEPSGAPGAARTASRPARSCPTLPRRLWGGGVSEISPASRNATDARCRDARRRASAELRKLLYLCYLECRQGCAIPRPLLARGIFGDPFGFVSRASSSSFSSSWISSFFIPEERIDAADAWPTYLAVASFIVNEDHKGGRLFTAEIAVTINPSILDVWAIGLFLVPQVVSHVCSFRWRFIHSPLDSDRLSI